jgi:CRISPR-associated protein Cas1
MDKATLIADETGSRLFLKQDVVVLEPPEGRPHRIGLAALKQILIKGDIEFSSRLLNRCLDAGVSLVLIPGRARDPVHHLLPHASGALPLRLGQYAAFLDPRRRLELAQTFVTEKIESQTECLKNRGLNAELQRFVHSVRQAADLSSLLGVEGAATAHYFNLWAPLLDPAWGFKGRNRRPPRDPVNALLSLSYTMACHAVGRIAGQEGFETTLGFLHCPEPGRPSFALDLMEPLRPWVDEWVLTLCADGGMTPDDFTTGPVDGCRLSKPASAKYFQRWFTTAEHWFEHEARQVLSNLRPLLNFDARFSG